MKTKTNLKAGWDFDQAVEDFKEGVSNLFAGNAKKAKEIVK